MVLPVNGSTHLIPALVLVCRSRKDERLSWPDWLTCSGWLTHISGHSSAAGRAQDRESSPETDVLPLCATPPTGPLLFIIDFGTLSFPIARHNITVSVLLNKVDIQLVAPNVLL